LYILWPFGIFCGNLVYFSPILVCLFQEKSGNPGSSIRSEDCFHVFTAWHQNLGGFQISDVVPGIDVMIFGDFSRFWPMPSFLFFNTQTVHIT
jgi:hypothetical protein